MSYQVVLAQKEDAALLLEYLKQVGSETDYLLFDQAGVPMTVSQEKAFLSTVNSTPYSRMFLIKDDGKVIANGYIYGSPRARIQHKFQIAVSVLKAYWGTGVSHLLMQTLIDYAKSTGFTETISLEVVSENIRAIKLYERFGFVAYGTVSKAIKLEDRYLDWVLMRLDL
jgi:RimJ/RimL family protein N-acetyltransferase